MLKAQTGEVESKGNPGQRANIWWGWHRDLQSRHYPEERLLHGSGRRTGLPQLKNTYPISIPRNPLPFLSEGDRRTYQRLSLELKASYFCTSPGQRNVLLLSLHQVCISQVCPSCNTTILWFASLLRKKPEQEPQVSEGAWQDTGSALLGEGPLCPLN